VVQTGTNWYKLVQSEEKVVQGDRKVGNHGKSWEILGKNCDSGIARNKGTCERGSFTWGEKFFILSWALAGAIERKKCKKLQFVAKIKKQKLGKQKWEINSNTEGRSFGREAREPARPDVSNAPGSGRDPRLSWPAEW